MNVSSYLLYQKQMIEKERELLDPRYRKISTQLKRLENIAEFIRKCFYYEETSEPEVLGSYYLGMIVWLPIGLFREGLCRNHKGYKIKRVADNSCDLHLTIEKDSVLCDVLVWKYMEQYVKLNILGGHETSH